MRFGALAIVIGVALLLAGCPESETDKVFRELCVEAGGHVVTEGAVMRCLDDRGREIEVDPWNRKVVKPR